MRHCCPGHMIAPVPKKILPVPSAVKIIEPKLESELAKFEKFWRKEMSALSDKITELSRRVDLLIVAVDKVLPNVATQADLDALDAVEKKVDAETVKASQ